MDVSGAENEPLHLVTLVAKDGALDEQLDARILLPSDLLKSMLPEDLSQVEEDFNVPLMGVERAVLEKVVEFLKLYHADPMRKIEKPLNKAKLEDLVQPQYVEYINSLHYKVIFSLIDAANFLGIESLLSLALAWVAFVLKGPTVEEFKKLFTIHNDFTPEEEAIFRREYLNPRRGGGAGNNSGQQAQGNNGGEAAAAAPATASS